MSVSTTRGEFKLNIALKYSVIEDILSVIIFKCTFKVGNLSYVLNLFQMNIFQTDKEDGLYSRTSLVFKNEEVATKKKRCFKMKNLLDFSKEHKFKLDGESLSDFHINIELKNSTQILQKSMLREK